MYWFLKSVLLLAIEKTTTLASTQFNSLNALTSTKSTSISATTNTSTSAIGKFWILHNKIGFKIV